jgi:hypothetical protein
MARSTQGSAIVDVGFRLKNLPVKKLFLQGTIYNLFNTRAEAGGSVVHPYPLPGRWFLVTLGYALGG